MVDPWVEVAAEREDLVGLLETLTPEQWDAPTLCDEWTVRDVVGHLVLGTSKLGVRKSMTDLLKAGFRLNKMLAATGKEMGRHEPEELLARMREPVNAKNAPPMTKPFDLLCDTMVHAQDIRRPLGKLREIPSDRLRSVLDHIKTDAHLGNKKRIAGLKLSASDMTWTEGDGPEVRGPGEALLMAMCGRKTAIDDLTGDGVATLRSR
jgi:uncharacterized protein (TIGR03083 family)